MTLERLRAQFAKDPQLYPQLPPQTDSRFGSIPGVPVGTTFNSRAELAAAGVHIRTFAGIAGNIRQGAYSIVMSNGYEDDEDQGEFFTYTGTGGKVDSFSSDDGPQTSDQSFLHHDNMALQLSVSTQRPVRVVRGPNQRSKFAPVSGFRYDGLYLVKKAYLGKGRSGFTICKYELRGIWTTFPAYRILVAPAL